MERAVHALAAVAAAALLTAVEARAEEFLLDEASLGGLLPAGEGVAAGPVAEGFTVPLGTYALGDTPLDLRLFTAGSYNFGAIDDWRHGAGGDGITLRGGVTALGAFAEPELRVSPRLGFVYTRPDEGAGFPGFTSAGSVPLEAGTPGTGVGSDRYGAELGLYADIPIAGDFSLYVDGAARFTYDDARGPASPGAGLSVGAFPSGGRTDAEAGWHLGGTLGGGVAMDWGRLQGSIGAEFERWQEPVSQATGDEPVSLGIESRDSWVLKAQVKLRF